MNSLLSATLPDDGPPAAVHAARSLAAAAFVALPLLLWASGNLCAVFVAVYLASFAVARALNGMKAGGDAPGVRSSRPAGWTGRAPAARPARQPLELAADGPLALAGLARLLDAHKRLGTVPGAVILDLKGFGPMDECCASLIASFGADCRRNGCAVLCRGADGAARAMLSSGHPGAVLAHLEDLQGDAGGPSRVQ